MNGQMEILNEFNKKYEEIKEKVTDINKRFIELTNQHNANNELFYIFKRDLHLLHEEMDSLRKLRDELKRDVSPADVTS